MRRMSSKRVRTLALAIVPCLLLIAVSVPGSSRSLGTHREQAVRNGVPTVQESEENSNEVRQRDLAFITPRLAGDHRLTIQQASSFRAAAVRSAARMRSAAAAHVSPATFDAPWTQLGPNPIVQVTRSTPIFSAMSGRIGALAIRPSNGQFILGAAQGGIWLYDTGTGTWTPKTDALGALAIGALAIAPSDDTVVYAGTGEGALSGDSYFGNGVVKSTDGGQTWSHVSGNYFFGVSISRMVVDPTNPNHVYAAVLRGRGGSRRTTPTEHSRYGVWESTDGGATWTLIQKPKDPALGATDLEIDPQNPNVLYSSFWGDAIYKSKNGGATWNKIMNGLPVSDYAATATRFSIGLSHPVGSPATLYTGFDYSNGIDDSRVWKSTNAGGTWTILPAGTGADSVEGYCGGQCSYDNVIEPDPTNPDVVFAAGQFNYGIGSGGIFRSDDGGLTWKNLGWDMHPDFHALAFDPSNTAHILMGNDGGVWSSTDRGGRPNASDPLDAVTWQDLNGVVDPNTAAVTHRTGLAISQFTSIANVPTVPARVWGGTQDNGTLRKSTASASWFDVASGDGGQVIVDPTDANFVYGTFFGITPYRYTDGGASFFSNQFIRTGINLNDRAEFYVPMTLNQQNPNQLFLGTYRLYRTDDAKATSPGDVQWNIISPDLTSGCPGPAPNGGRGCYISAIGVGGGQAVYTGSEEGRIYLSKNAQTAASPTWHRVDQHALPHRPIAQIAVDRSNYRVAYAAFNGFDAATPTNPGHVFATTDGGDTWTNITGNLPDSPVNSLLIDAALPGTLYAGTDVGAFVTHDDGASWSPLGTAGTMPLVAIWQLDMDPAQRVIAAGTHGRGAFRIVDGSTAPALVITKADDGTPVGPGSTVNYTITVRNIGNANATGVTITDPVPANTTFESADSGGTPSGGVVTWSGLSVPAGGTTSVHLSVNIADPLKPKVKAITNDGYGVTSSEGSSATGSPISTPIAPKHAVSVTPAELTDGGRVGTTVPNTLTVHNDGSEPDSYTVTATGAWTTGVFAADCSTPLSTTGTLPPGGTQDVCVTVDVPPGAANAATNTTTVTATSVANPAVSGSALVTTIAVAVDTLLVDQDGNAPNVQPFYSDALAANGIEFSVWDLANDPNLPQHFLNSFHDVVWFTGNTYPGPLLPYESKLQSFLDGGGRLLVSGQDILDQSAGTTAFVHDYLHITWDGTEAQNDKATAAVHGVSGSPVSDGVGSVPLDHSVLGATFEDRITPNGTAAPAFTDDSAATDALSFAGAYKVVFLAFPLEAYGSSAQKADLVHRVMTFFG